MHGKLSNLPCTLKPALNVACPTACEIGHRQGKELPAQEVENGRIESNGRKRQQIFLGESGELHKDDRGEHAEQDSLQQAEVVFDDDLIDHHLSEHREEQLQKTDSDSQRQRLQQDHLKTREKWKHPRQRGLAFRRLLKCRGVIEQGRIPGPLHFKFAPGKFSQSPRWIGHAHKLLIDIVEHDPVIAFPMHNCGQRH